jgi:hypothetical protein
MKKQTRWVLIGSTAVVLLLGMLFLMALMDRQAIETSRQWARLDPFPASATQIEVDTKGGMFTREFIVTFTSPLADINAWLAVSPGTAGAMPDMALNGVRVYQITPGGGAQFAEVKVDDKAEKVTIHTYWS